MARYKDGDLRIRRYKSVGHWFVQCKGHPRAQSKWEYVPEHIVVYERTHNCCVLKWGVVHHKDHDGLNNAPDNLQGMMRGQHGRHHNKGKVHTEQSRLNMSIAHKGQKAWNKGKKLVGSQKGGRYKFMQKT